MQDCARTARAVLCFNKEVFFMQPKESRIKELLRRHGLDGAIVSSPENFHYVTGFGGHQHTVSRQPGFSVAVVSAREDVPTQLTSPGRRGLD